MGTERRIKFHEDGSRYYWDRAAQEVYDEEGTLVAVQCYNLKVARDKVRLYQGRGGK